jgi:DNA-binding transcriptional MerR regulator
MAHQIAKLILEHAQTPHEREDAIQKAIALGMPLHEIEQYLDWLDAIRRHTKNQSDGPSSTD